MPQITPDWLQYGSFGLLAIFLILLFAVVTAVASVVAKGWTDKIKVESAANLERAKERGAREQDERIANAARLDKMVEYNRSLVDRTITSMNTLTSESNKSQKDIAAILQSLCQQVSSGMEKMSQEHDRQIDEHKDIRAEISGLRGDLGRR